MIKTLICLIKKNAGSMSASFITALYMFGCMAVMWLVDLRAVDKDAYYFTAMPMPGFGDVKYYVYAWYLFFMVMVYLVTRMLPRGEFEGAGALDVLASRLGILTAFLTVPFMR